MIVLVTNDFYDQYLDLFKKHSQDHVEFVRFDSQNLLGVPEGVISKVKIIITRKDIDDEIYQKAKNLKLIQVPIAGYESFDLKRAQKYNVFVANNGGANAYSVAEHALMLMLSIYRQFPYHYQKAHIGPFENKKYENKELYQKTLGIIGLGNCGKALAKRAAAFGMKILYYDLIKLSKGSDLKVEFCGFEELLKKSDIVSMHVPLTRLTRSMMNAESFKKMKKTAVLINTSRGSVVNEQDLIEALNKGIIHAAALDVFEKEPLPLNSPLKSISNLIMTPHAGSSYESIERTIKNICLNIDCIAQERAPQFLAVNYHELS